MATKPSSQNSAKNNLSTDLQGCEKELGALRKEFEDYRKRIEDKFLDLIDIMANVAQGDFSRKPEITEDEEELSGLLVGLRFMIEDLEQAKKQQESAQKALEEKIEELKKRSAELEKMNKFMIGRELKMRELKREITILKQKLKKI